MGETCGRKTCENKANSTRSLKFQVGSLKGRPPTVHLQENRARRHYKPGRIVQNKANLSEEASDTNCRSGQQLWIKDANLAAAKTKPMWPWDSQKGKGRGKFLSL
jgi:hypothetical protein